MFRLVGVHVVDRIAVDQSLELLLRADVQEVDRIAVVQDHAAVVAAEVLLVRDVKVAVVVIVVPVQKVVVDQSPAVHPLAVVHEADHDEVDQEADRDAVVQDQEVAVAAIVVVDPDLEVGHGPVVHRPAGDHEAAHVVVVRDHVVVVRGHVVVVQDHVVVARGHAVVVRDHVVLVAAQGVVIQAADLAAVPGRGDPDLVQQDQGGHVQFLEDQVPPNRDHAQVRQLAVLAHVHEVDRGHVLFHDQGRDLNHQLPKRKKLKKELYLVTQKVN